MKFLNIKFTSILLINLFCVIINAQRSSNGRHRTWWSSEEEPPQASLTINDDLIINQNVPFSKKEKIKSNNSIIVNLEEDHSINNLTPEPLAAEILKVDLNIDKSGMVISSRPTYLLTNHSDKEIWKKEDENLNNDKNINFIATKRMFNPNSASKNCLSTLDCDLELNERCLAPESEEVLYYDQLIKLQDYTSVYSPYLRKKFKRLKTLKPIAENAFERLENDKNLDQPICGCSSPSFIRNQHTGICELMRAVELKFKIITDHITSNINRVAVQNFEQQSYNQIKLDALGQIDHVIKNSDSLQDIVHHFRLTNLKPLMAKNRKTNENSDENLETKIENGKKKKRSISSMIRMESKFIARGLLFLFSSEYTTSFDQLFTNEYCTTQNNLRLKAQENFFHQTLSATNQTISTKLKHTNMIRSADFWSSFNKNLNSSSIETDLKDQTDQMKYMKQYLKNRNRSENQLIEMMPSFIYHRKKRQTTESKVLDRKGLDVQLIEVNSDKINICELSSNYATEQLNEARRKYQIDKRKDNNSNSTATDYVELEKMRKKLDYERKFLRITYCDTQRAFCESLPRSRAGYVCVCHDNLMDLSPIPAQDQIPAEYCGIKCNLDCGAEGFCHVRNSVGNYPSPDYDLATQQRFLSTAGRMMTFQNGKLNEKRKEDNSSKLEKEEESELELADYQSLLEAHKKNQTLLKQRYYAAIYSVQQRFAQLFENMDSGSSNQIKDSKTDNGKNKFDYTYSFVQTPQLVTFYCTCPGYTMGSRCQFSGWMILLVLGILVILLALITICTVSWLCAPLRSKRKDSTKSNKSNMNTTTSLTISDTSDSLDIETGSQQFNSSNQSVHHNQFNNQLNRQRRASEFVNDGRSSFNLQSTNQDNKSEWNNNKSIKKPEFNFIHATPPHSAKETQKIQFTDSVTEIPYDLPYEREIAQISSKIQQQIPTSTYNTASYTQQIQKPSRIPINLDRLLKRDDNERRFEFYDSPNRMSNHIYNVIADNQNDSTATIDNKPFKKENTTQTPISHVHNVYASAGELRIEREELPSSNDLQIERRSVGSQTSGFQSGDPSLAYLSAISLKQLQFEQQQQKTQQKTNQLPTISGPIVWF